MRIAQDGTKTPRIVAEGPSADTLEVSIPAKDFLFSQASIVASVMLENNSHLIHSDFSKYVNNNGDTWSNDSLKANYKSWTGAYNFVNHQARDDFAVGVVLDAAMRRNFVNASENLWNYYTDILIATHRDFKDLVGQITNGGVEYLSMGCDAMKIQCSKCGAQHDGEPHQDCGHQSSKGKYFVDRAGTRRISADILGTSEAGTVEFTEASWLTIPPAFHGAVHRNILPIDRKASVRIMFPKKAVERKASSMFLGFK